MKKLLPFITQVFSPKLVAITILMVFMANTDSLMAQYFVDMHGQLKVDGNKIVDKNNQPIQLRGMSLFWSQWTEDTSKYKSNQYYNPATIQWLRDDWKITVVRAAMGVEAPLGYKFDPSQAEQVTKVVDAAIALGIYVIIDFHSHDAAGNKDLAIKFFTEMAQKYKGYPNIIYEIWNEPITRDWGQIKSYHEDVIDAIRAIDQNNIILCGTGFYCQEIEAAANNPINKPNLAYVLHYYAAEHDFMNQARSAMSKGIAVFVSEYGTVNANGGGAPNAGKSEAWWNFMDENKISNCNWSVYDKNEGASALKLGTTPEGGWSENDLTESGKMVRAYLRRRADQDPVTSTENNTNSNMVSVAPNPFDNRLTIQHRGDFKYTLLNTLGEEILKGEGRDMKELTTNVKAGVYNLKIDSKDSNTMVKIVKH